MDTNLILAMVVFVVSAALTVVLARLRFVRANPLLIGIFLVNPGLVGICATLTLLSQLYFPNLTLPLWILSLVFIFVTLPALIFVLPKAMFTPGDQSDDDRR